jgi:tRNA(adenine34) deaminase
MTPTNPQDLELMRQALVLADEAAKLGEVPVGALIVKEGIIVGQGMNRREIDCDPLAHAEMHAISEASKKLGAWRLSGCTLYVTLEPCIMCAGAIVQSRISRLVYATDDAKAGAVKSLYELLNDSRLNHRVEVLSGVLQEEAEKQLKVFFKELRSKKKIE